MCIGVMASVTFPVSGRVSFKARLPVRPETRCWVTFPVSGRASLKVHRPKHSAGNVVSLSRLLAGRR